MLNGYFTRVIIQVIKNKLIGNYRAYVRMRNKMIKMQHNGLYTLNKEWFDDNLLEIKQGSLKKAKLSFLVIVLSENKQCRFIFIFFHHD